jgi:molybdopterin-containing oxidoreductase family iron-sulfur binding subunit
MDETASQMSVVLPSNHFLESWGDFLPKKKYYTLSQPTISPLFDSKQFEDVLLYLTGKDYAYSDYLKEFFTAHVEPKVAGLTWNKAVQNGVVEKEQTAEDYFITSAAVYSIPDLKLKIIEALVQSSIAFGKQEKGDYEIVFYQKTGIGSGNMANNPWLHELPDPVSRISWDNYLTISATDAITLGFDNWHESNGGLNGNYANLTIGGQNLEKVPVFIQPGQTPGSVALSVGFGRTAVGKAGNGVGVNAYALITDGAHWNTNVTIENAGGEHHFASTQLGHTMMGRKIVNEVKLNEYLNGDPHHWNHIHTFPTYKGPLSSSETNLWDDLDHETMHLWNLSIDLNACTGCGACIVACHLENNVPVVGKQEVRKHRDMHWLRVDRYYSSDMTEERAETDGIGARDKYLAMEVASESPEVVFQPVMCQHCNHAPCETVCPVAATSHSREGLNHMAYNRCIGTRYCANNCPYKVRRFNWFNYTANKQFKDVNPSQDDYGRMVLNPDVTVRTRGVMEKCSMCVQRIQYAKLEAKKKGKKVEDGSFTVACAQACSTGAMVFGDANNKDSQVAELRKDSRAYNLLDEVGTQPTVFYQTKVRNKA